MTEPRLHLYRRDARQIGRMAQEIERQADVCERHIEEHGEAEALRFALMQRLADDLRKVAKRGAKRYWKARGE
ncbi:hypothetical protein LCGC14_0382340 [marine sediment metagenome]|uniref:Uncharacterized protein n=1 Tax=marine sediment metagenome TaxID=412755 RepID=A0A0F9T1P4_9ZZZZ